MCKSLKNFTRKPVSKNTDLLYAYKQDIKTHSYPLYILGRFSHYLTTYRPRYELLHPLAEQFPAERLAGNYRRQITFETRNL